MVLFGQIPAEIQVAPRRAVRSVRRGHSFSHRPACLFRGQIAQIPPPVLALRHHMIRRDRKREEIIRKW